MNRPDFEKSMPNGMASMFVEKQINIIVQAFRPTIIATDGPTKKRMISGFVDLDQTYALTILTNQSTGMITKIIKQGGCLVVTGVFSKEIFEGYGGERYRPIFGKIEVLK